MLPASAPTGILFWIIVTYKVNNVKKLSRPLLEEPVLLLSDRSLIATIPGEHATSLQAHKTILHKSTLNIEDIPGFSDILPLRISWTISYCRSSEHVFLRQKTCSLMRYLTYDYYSECIPTTTYVVCLSGHGQLLVHQTAWRCKPFFLIVKEGMLS